MSEESTDCIREDTNPIEMTSASPHRRTHSLTSRFYDADSVDDKVEYFIHSTSTNVKQKDPDRKIRQSRHLPIWAWYIIAKTYGIPLKPGSRPILGTIIHALTFTTALAYAASYTWFVVFDILSPNTPRDIPGGFVSVLLVYFWCSFGFYCKDLSSRLLLHQRFLKDIRMHSRTVFKINGAVLAFILSLCFTAANVTEGLYYYNAEVCKNIKLQYVVCHLMSVSSIVFCIFTLVWHSVVSFIFMSVCRTHTIGIRRFIKEVECDASLIERHLSFTKQVLPISQEDVWQESLWIAEDENDEEYSKYIAKTQHTMSFSQRNINPSASSATASNPGHFDPSSEISVLFAPITENMELNDDTTVNYEWNNDSDEPTFIPVRKLLNGQNNVPQDSTVSPHKLSNAELLHHFWKLNCRLRFSSYALQRWYASFVSLVLVRCSTYLVHWLAHPASVFDILQFLLPLILLVVLSTAIAEVNFEGQRSFRCVYPSELRIKPLQYMGLNPLQMSIYGFGMTHGTIVTVVFAILAGFFSKIVITEISKVT